jgi:hypothetical protein
MTRSVHPATLASLLVVASLLPARRATGQQAEGPPNATQPATPTDSLPFRAGQWGAEFLVDDGTAGVGVLRFRTPRRAWLLDASFAASWYDAESSFTPDESGSSVFVRVRTGPRRYRPLATGSAAYLGFGFTAGYGWAGAGEGNRRQTWDAGLFGELGGVYFVTRRFSLGAQAGVYATFYASYQRSSSPSYGTRDRGVIVQLRPVRIVGGLYF